MPVGQVIARISETAEASAPVPVAAAFPADALPEGRAVTMPQLGMAQDTGVVVAWHVAPGDKVAEGDVLFEVETDKTTMEVPATEAGYVAALLAGEGEEVPVGEAVAILTDAPPAAPFRRTRGGAGVVSAGDASRAAAVRRAGSEDRGLGSRRKGPAAGRARPVGERPHPRLAESAQARAGTRHRPRGPRRGGRAAAIPRPRRRGVQGPRRRACVAPDHRRDPARRLHPLRRMGRRNRRHCRPCRAPRRLRSRQPARGHLERTARSASR